MSQSLEHALFRESIRRFVTLELAPHVDEWEANGAWPAHDVLRRMGALGFLGLTYPDAYGGQDLDFSFSVVLYEELGALDCTGVPMGIAVHSDMATPALAEHGSDELRRHYLAPALAGEMVACVAVTEPDAGSDVAAIATRAEPDGEDWVITGRKLYITNGAQADWACLLARTSPSSPGSGSSGMSLILTPLRLPGVTIGQPLRKLGARSSDTVELVFDGVRVPRTHTIGAEGAGFKLLMAQFQRERIIGAVLAYSACARVVRQTIAYTQQRQAFGRPIAANQSVRFHLAAALTEIEATSALCERATQQIVAGADATRLASMAKLKAGRLAREVSDNCLQYFGGLGYMEETTIARAYRDLRLTSIAGGADEVMLDLIARAEGMPSR